jgi:hypothetical protein
LGSAIISDCGLYRYRLEREIAPAGIVIAKLWENPSTADHEKNDQTVMKGMGFSLRLGARLMIVGNEFAYRATDINDLRSVRDPIGPDNDKHLEQIMRDADLHIVGWGSRAKLPENLRSRWKDVVRIADRVGCKLHCIGVTSDGHPKHPLMTGYNVAMTQWTAPWFPNRRAA